MRIIYWFKIRKIITITSTTTNRATNFIQQLSLQVLNLTFSD